MLSHAFLLVALLLGFPSPTSAKQETVWNFQKGIPGAWHIDGCLSAKQTSDGFSITTGAHRCSVQRKTNDVRHPIEALSLTALSPLRTEMVFLWHRRNSPQNHMVELPLILSTSDEPQTINFNLPAYSQWDTSTDRIGFSFPPHSTVILQRITFTQWSLWEKAAAALQSFWTFDTFRPYAINFLWGPIVGWNPLWQEQLFLKVPPRGWSANRLFAVLALPLLCLSLVWHWRTRRETLSHHTLALFGTVFASLWLLSDLRMGLEIGSYIRNDWQTYVLPSPGERTFRVFDNFPDMVETVLPLITREERYGFAGPPGTPFGSFLRYRSFPTTLVDAAWPAKEREGLRYWFIVLRPDTHIGPKGELFLDQEQLSPPGTIIHNFRSNAVLFEVTEPAPQDSKDVKETKNEKTI